MGIPTVVGLKKTCIFLKIIMKTVLVMKSLMKLIPDERYLDELIRVIHILLVSKDFLIVIQKICMYSDFPFGSYCEKVVPVFQVLMHSNDFWHVISVMDIKSII